MSAYTACVARLSKSEALLLWPCSGHNYPQGPARKRAYKLTGVRVLFTGSGPTYQISADATVGEGTFQSRPPGFE